MRIPEKSTFAIETKSRSLVRPPINVIAPGAVAGFFGKLIVIGFTPPLCRQSQVGSDRKSQNTIEAIRLGAAPFIKINDLT